MAGRLWPSQGGTDVRTGQNPPILKDIAPFGAAAQKVKFDRQVDGPTDGRTDIVTYRVARTRLKNDEQKSDLFSFFVFLSV